jgi:hypothetical protein
MWCARAAPVNAEKCSNTVATRESGVLYGQDDRKGEGSVQCPDRLWSLPSLPTERYWELVILGIELWDLQMDHSLVYIGEVKEEWSR